MDVYVLGKPQSGNLEVYINLCPIIACRIDVSSADSSVNDRPLSHV
jgi:hypothetical protein